MDAILKRMIISFCKFVNNKSDTVHVHAEFDVDIFLQYCFMDFHF